MAVTKKKTTTKPTSAADFRKADIGSMVAFNRTQDKDKQSPVFLPPSSQKGSLSGVGMNEIMAYLQSLGGGGAGGGSGMSAADRAQIALERRKLRSQNRQFNQELGLQREQMAGQQAQQAAELGFEREQFTAQQKAAADALARQQTGIDAYMRGIQGLIDRGPSNRGLYDTLTKLASGAGRDITSSYDALAQSLGAITNPFAGYQAQAVSSPTAGLEEFLGSQGVGTDDLTRFAQLQQAQSAQQAQAANNLMAQLGGIFQGGQQSRLAEAAMGRTADANALALNKLLMEAQLGQQGQSEMDDLRKLLLQAQMQRAGL